MMLHKITRSLLLSFVTLAIARIASAGSVVIVPADQVCDVPSDIITVDVYLDSDPDHVTAFSMHIQWTAGLSLVSVVEFSTFPGIYWDGLPGDGGVDAMGLLLAQEDVVAPPAGGGVFDLDLTPPVTSIPLATLQFHVTPQTLGSEIISPVFDPESDGVTYWDGSQEVLTLDYTLNPGEVVVEDVPEPSSELVLGLGMSLLACSRRRRQESARQRT